MCILWQKLNTPFKHLDNIKYPYTGSLYAFPDLAHEDYIFLPTILSESDHSMSNL